MTKKEELKKLELATMISHAPSPYEKTKILRIVQRIVVVNHLNRDLVLKEPHSETETVLCTDEPLDYDFLNSNDRNSLLLRMADADDTQVVAEEGNSQWKMTKKH